MLWAFLAILFVNQVTYDVFTFQQVTPCTIKKQFQHTTLLFLNTNSKPTGPRSSPNHQPEPWAGQTSLGQFPWQSPWELHMNPDLVTSPHFCPRWELIPQLHGYPLSALLLSYLIHELCMCLLFIFYFSTELVNCNYNHIFKYRHPIKDLQWLPWLKDTSLCTWICDQIM